MNALFADSDLLLSALATLLVTVDPLGLVPIFISLTATLDAAGRRVVALWSTIIAFIVLALFALGGEMLLDLLGIGLPAFRVAGGLLLFYTAFEMVFERRQARKEGLAESAMSRDEMRNLAAFPLAIPLMAGPGAITASILLAPPAGSDLTRLTGLLIIIAAVCLICLAVFLASEPLQKILGETARTVLTRLLGIVLAALAVQFVADGVKAMVAG